ncbi:MAG: hypothetical protein Q4D38_11665 [Planctomycetia bacterium]|nr:hypothetical protein [Planctomycetia bacterium]
MTKLDEIVERAFRTHLRLDGRKALYRRGGESAEMDVLADTITEEVLTQDGINVARQWKRIVFLSSEFPFGKPREGDSVVLQNAVYRPVQNGSRRYYDFEDASEMTMVVELEKTGEKVE